VIVGGNITVGVGCVIEENVSIGDNCFIGHYAIIRPGTIIGDNVDIRAYVFIANNVTIGSDVTIYQYANIGAGTILEDNIYFGSKSICTNTNINKKYHPKGNDYISEPPLIQSGAVIATACVLKPGVVVGRNSVLGMGSLLTKNIPDNEVWYGSPAKYVRELPKELMVVDI
jgi:acetyltransferase-like isoleucine patch superfamily enzyme